jgi:hypothetical protein
VEHRDRPRLGGLELGVEDASAVQDDRDRGLGVSLLRGRAPAQEIVEDVGLATEESDGLLVLVGRLADRSAVIASPSAAPAALELAPQPLGRGLHLGGWVRS